MDITPLTQAAAFKGEQAAKQQLAPQPFGAETTQTEKAVQALDKTGSNVSQGEAEQKQKQEQKEPLNGEQLTKIVEEMDEFVGTFNRGLKFRVDEDSGQQVVTVVDNKTGDTIRQIPTEELLEVVARLAEASGGLIDVKA
ncbi:flagellar protein FlaG [Oceanisphaera pacifica]|uniref:Flagellar protein FlaG n=1 Tax=Oceanisphaera pacifica TaxID=2818389 RepID=A0ABS3NJF7_9GAMM|nr:flagellar protein FlaG [Oceanisphaera pacifica]MBO1520738.1 flagellar protein FlaG [Oceanisphaera pacifica]